MAHTEEFEKISDLNDKIFEVLFFIRKQLYELSCPPTATKNMFELREKIKQLKSENQQLKNECDMCTQMLAGLMIENGTKQSHLKPFIWSNVTDDDKADKKEADNSVDEDKDDKIAEIKKSPQIEETKSAKEKKPIKGKGSKECTVKNTNVSEAEKPVDFGRLDIRIGRIISVEKHPDADTLYVEKVDFGNGTIKTVVSGLVKYLPVEELQNQTTLFLCNLKPVKMRGILSEGMLLCANGTDKIEILQPPKNAVPGDIVTCQAFDRDPDTVLNPKKKIFETVAADFKINESGVAVYKNTPIVVPWKGIVNVPTLTDVMIK